jgi:hypothetical protein
MFSGPGNSGVQQVQSTPTGLLAVFDSFLLFGLGTLSALTRNRWHKSESD